MNFWHKRKGTSKQKEMSNKKPKFNNVVRKQKRTTKRNIKKITIKKLPMTDFPFVYKIYIFCMTALATRKKMPAHKKEIKKSININTLYCIGI